MAEPLYSVSLWEGDSVAKRNPSCAGWRIFRNPDGTVTASATYYRSRQACRTYWSYTVDTLPARAPKIVREMLASLT
jgi:hypothetical protein